MTTAVKKRPPTKKPMAPNRSSSGDSNVADSQRYVDTQTASAVSDPNLTSGHGFRDDHRTSAAGDLTIPGSHWSAVIQTAPAVGDQTTRDDHVIRGTQPRHVVSGPLLVDHVLGLFADAVDDLEMVRVANENRLRTLTRPAGELDKDGLERGHGLTLDHPQVAKLAAIVDALTSAEQQAVKNLETSMKQHPLGAWVKKTVGVGEKQAARLLSVIRDPYWNDLHNRPRTVSELWSYCGWGDPAHQVRRRGQKSNWNDDARKRVWLIASQCVRYSNSPYRLVYDEARTKYADAVHASECVRCGPKGKPAQPGSPLSLGHQHARAIRRMAKEILKDLWRESKRIHEAA